MGIQWERTYYSCTNRRNRQKNNKESGQESSYIPITHTLFLQKLRYEEGLSSGKMLFYINASVTPNWKWIGHIPFGCHLRGWRTLIHMSHSCWRTKSWSWATYHMLLKSYPRWFKRFKIITELFYCTAVYSCFLLRL